MRAEPKGAWVMGGGLLDEMKHGKSRLARVERSEKVKGHEIEMRCNKSEHH